MADSDQSFDVPPTPVPTNIDTAHGPTDEEKIRRDLYGKFGAEPPKDQPKPQPEVKPQSEGDYFLQRQMELYQRDRARADESDAQYQQYRKELSDINSRLNQPAPQRPQYQQYPALPTSEQYQQQQTQGRSLSTVIGQVISIAAIASAVFGRHRNPWAQANIMAGAGAFMQNFAQGQHQQAQDALQTWNKNLELIHKQNAEETQDYHNILADRRLDLQEQMALIRDVASRRRDVEMYNASSQKDLNEVVKLVTNKAKAQLSWARGHVDAVTRVRDLFMKTQGGRSWAAYVLEQSHGKLNPLASPEDYLKAQEKYPVSAWIESEKQFGKTQTTYEGGKPETRTFGPKDVYSKGIGKPGEPVSPDDKKAFEELGMGDQTQ